MVGLKIKDDFFLIGSSDFFRSFFDNIHCHLERPKPWGTKYPLLFRAKKPAQPGFLYQHYQQQQQPGQL